MSTNHLQESAWWAQQHNNHQQIMEPSMNFSPRKQNPTMFCTQNTAFTFNLNHEDDEEQLDEQLINEPEKGKKEKEEEEFIPKEGLFEKPLTPSDVGKLNRLVIPKQHAEKYFPLSSTCNNNNNDSGEKGLLLSFEDELGKSWKFRYSYWNSSQSYVLTKGWSRFVKDKKLDAGDIVMFERHRIESDRFFIGWRRRNAPVNPVRQDGGVAQPVMVVGGGGGGGWTPVFYSGHPYPSHSHGPPHHLPYQPDSFHAGSIVQNQTPSSGHPKRLRLFGVNMVCEPDESSEPSTPDGSSMSSSHGGGGQPHHHYNQYQNYSNKSHVSYDHHNHNHMEDIINFSRDVNQMGYHQR